MRCNIGRRPSHQRCGVKLGGDRDNQLTAKARQAGRKAVTARAALTALDRQPTGSDI
jgi:hypothetical protein